jgi:hypothetical protein
VDGRLPHGPRIAIRSFALLYRVTKSDGGGLPRVEEEEGEEGAAEWSPARLLRRSRKVAERTGSGRFSCLNRSCDSDLVLTRWGKNLSYGVKCLTRVPSLLLPNMPIAVHTVLPTARRRQTV